MWDIVFEHEITSHVYDSLDLDFAQIRFGEHVSLQSCTSTAGDASGFQEFSAPWVLELWIKAITVTWDMAACTLWQQLQTAPRISWFEDDIVADSGSQKTSTISAVCLWDIDVGQNGRPRGPQMLV